MTSASSFQMLRGAVIIFTGLLSVAFLGRRLTPSQWVGILTTILGLVIVGLADFFSGHSEDTHKLSDIVTGEEDFGLPGNSKVYFSGFGVLTCLHSALLSCRRPSDHPGSGHCFRADGAGGKVCLQT